MNQSNRLANQHKHSQGVQGIFGDEAKKHDAKVADISQLVIKYLQEKYPALTFRYRSSITKEEINSALQKVDKDLGHTLFLHDSMIKPDGGIIEVKDDNDNWRVILVSEAKHQGKDIENLIQGKKVGKNNDQDLMLAGNAIERAYKNIFEIANFMLGEAHFPYVLFLDGSNFLTEDIHVKCPDGRIVTLACHNGTLNRLDRLTAANYGMDLNTNLCKNRMLSKDDKSFMLQATSIFTTGDGQPWEAERMFGIMLEIAETSIKILACDLFTQLTSK